jgi:hypothetical protein
MNSGIAFFETSLCHASTGATATATAGASTAPYVLTHRPANKWMGPGVITVTTPAPVQADTIFLASCNAGANPVVEYWTGSAWAGLPGAVVAIEAAGAGKQAAYIAFTATTASQWRVSGLDYLERFILTRRIGQFRHHAVSVPDVSTSFNDLTQRNLAGRAFVQRGEPVLSASFSFQYLGSQSDVDLLDNLRGKDAFLLWLCGGETRFRVTQPEWRFDGIYKMGAVGDRPANYYKNLFMTGATTSLKMVELA